MADGSRIDLMFTGFFFSMCCRSTTLCIVLGAFLMFGCKRESVDLSIKVGDPAPPFTLKNQSGADVKLQDLLSRKKFLAIVFYRSADW